MGGSYALRFACHRKRLRAAVSYYGRMVRPNELMKDLTAPILYHQADSDTWATEEETNQLRRAAEAYGKRADIHLYPKTRHGFCNDMKPETYDADSTTLAWERTATFLKSCFEGT